MKDDDITVIINILSSLASSLKPHILLTLRTAQFEDSTKCLILSEFNDILREMDPSAAPICQYHCIIETIEACEPLTPSNLNINVFKTAIEKFILITSLATVCQLFVRCCVAMFELSNSNHASDFLENFAGIFAETDNILDSASLQYHPHLWYYYVASLHCDEDCFQQISDSLIEAGFQFSHPEQFELILSKLFTQCFLQNDDSSTQQKDRGQCYRFQT
ncbi:hypothetical protein BKA69DRAFT_139466 [Paraphysoderma sedebokerense]|nr:hypothetical protein BKA69DRAFT_139466 [Paraphysoderma sedebokerense]